MLDVSHAALQEPLGLSPWGRYGFREKNHAPGNCQSTRFQSNRHLENHFTQTKTGDESERRPARKSMMWRKGNIAGCHDEQAKNKKQTEVGGT